MDKIVLVLCFTKVWAEGTITAVAGVDLDVSLQCSIEGLSFTGHDLPYWMINGSVYGLLHVTQEFEVCSGTSCDLSILKIPTIQRELDGFTFQCFHINYHQNRVMSGRTTVLEVLTLPFNSKLIRS